MADDLGDEWWLEGENDADILPKEQAEEADKPREKKSKKRKRDSSKVEQDQNQKSSKKKKKKTLTQELAEKEPKAPESTDFISKWEKHFAGKLSAVEVDENEMKESYFMDHAGVKDTYETYITHQLSDWNDVNKATLQPGAPVVLILCSAALRAIAVTKDMMKFCSKKIKIGKLFAKHKKISEQVAFLNKNTIHVAIGTPHRVAKLIDEGALKTDSLKYVILDWSWRDDKLRQLAGIAEIRTDLFNLFKSHLMDILREDKTKIGLI